MEKRQVWGLTCKAGCDDMRRSVAFARNPNISMQQRFEEGTRELAERMCMNRREIDAAVQCTRDLCSPRLVEGVKFA